MIRIERLRKSYGDKPAVVDLHLQVAPGEIVGFIGPNGAGKSTTLKVLTGLLTPDAGSASICGSDIVANPVEAKRRFGYVPENPKLYEALTADAFLDIVGSLHHLDRRVSERRREALLELLGLAESRHQWLRQFSKGMRQKIVLAAAIIHQPDVLILDEPFDGVDANMVLVLKSLLREMAAQGRAVLISSHVMDVVERLCSRVAIIRGGQLIADGSPDEIQRQTGTPTLETAFAALTATRDAAEVTAGVLDTLSWS